MGINHLKRPELPPLEARCPLPSRKMAIYTSLIEQLNATDDEIARVRVMGHEISHALAEHTRERMSVAYSTGAATTIAAIALGAGYDPMSAVTLWDEMGKVGGGRQPEFFSAHPSPEHRAEALRELGAKVQPLYLEAKAHPPAPARHVNLTGSPGVTRKYSHSPKLVAMRGCAAFALIFVLAGCAAVRSYDSELTSTLGQASAGNLDGAIKTLQANNPLPDKDLLYFFELGMLQRYSQRYDKSQKAWQSALAQIEAPKTMLDFGASLVRGASSYVVGDKLRTYEPRDYEKVMLTTHMAMNFLAEGKFESARVAIKQTHELEASIAQARAKQLAEVEKEAKKRGAVTNYKQLNGYPVKIIDNPEVNALRNGYQSALSHYLAGFIYEALGELSLAAPGYRLAAELQPNKPLLEQGLAGLEERTRPVADDGMVDVLFIVSSGSAPPIKPQQVHLPVPVNQRMLFVPISFPVLVPSRRNEMPMSVTVTGAQRLPLTRITSIDLMARRSLKDEMPSIMLRATVRSTTSAVLQYEAQRHGSQQAGPALGTAAVIATSLLSTADDRTWRTLPGEIAVARARLPPGEHHVTVQTPYGDQRTRVRVSGRYAVLDFRVLSSQLFVQAPRENHQ